MSLAVLGRWPGTTDLVATPCGLIGVRALDARRARATDASTQLALYSELCGVVPGPDGFLTFPRRRWRTADLCARLRAAWNLELWYLPAPGASLGPPPATVTYQARDDFFPGLYAAGRHR